MFGDGPYGHDPLGTTASLQRLSSQDVVNQWPRLANRQAFLVVSAAHDQALADGLERRLQRFAHDSVKRLSHWRRAIAVGALIPSTLSKPC